MNFARHDIIVELGERRLLVSIAPDALLFWWGADVGPQTAEGLVAQHIEEIEQVVRLKIERGSFESDGSISVLEEDLE